MSKKKIFSLIFIAVITATIMFSYKKDSDTKITDAFLHNESNSASVCVMKSAPAVK